jgi:hypothetical protein
LAIIFNLSVGGKILRVVSSFSANHDRYLKAFHQIDEEGVAFRCWGMSILLFCCNLQHHYNQQAPVCEETVQTLRKNS